MALCGLMQDANCQLNKNVAACKIGSYNEAFQHIRRGREWEENVPGLPHVTWHKAQAALL